MEGEARKQASYKRIILCVDGTWLASDIGNKSTPSNVARLARAIAPSGIDSDGNAIKQIVYYHAGLGSGDLPLQKAINGSLGWGLDDDVCQTYDFVSNNYEPRDELFFFGFSRGAFTVRSAANLVCEVGVLSAVHMSHFAEMWAAYRDNTSGQSFKESTWYIENKEKLGLRDLGVKVNVVGVWDTVGALGVPQWPVVGWAAKMGLPINKRYAFHNTSVSKNMDYAFQALAIDERRLTFPPTVWHETTGGPARELRQCWFPGVHGDIGGTGGEGADVSPGFAEIGHNTFAWMVDNLSKMLSFEESAIRTVIEEHRRGLKAIGLTTSWGCGPVGQNFSGLQGAFFKALGAKDRTPGRYPPETEDSSHGATNECFHPIARIRKDSLNYRPASLEGFDLQNTDNAGWKWVRNSEQIVPEYVLRPEKSMSLRYEDAGTVKYRLEESLSRLMCPRHILDGLDRDNGTGNVGV